MDDQHERSLALQEVTETRLLEREKIVQRDEKRLRLEFKRVRNMKNDDSLCANCMRYSIATAANEVISTDFVMTQQQILEPMKPTTSSLNTPLRKNKKEEEERKVSSALKKRYEDTVLEVAKDLESIIHLSQPSTPTNYSEKEEEEDNKSVISTISTYHYYESDNQSAIIQSAIDCQNQSIEVDDNFVKNDDELFKEVVYNASPSSMKRDISEVIKRMNEIPSNLSTLRDYNINIDHDKKGENNVSVINENKIIEQHDDRNPKKDTTTNLTVEVEESDLLNKDKENEEELLNERINLISSPHTTLNNLEEMVEDRLIDNHGKFDPEELLSPSLDNKIAAVMKTSISNNHAVSPMHVLEEGPITEHTNDSIPEKSKEDIKDDVLFRTDENVNPKNTLPPIPIDHKPAHRRSNSKFNLLKDKYLKDNDTKIIPENNNLKENNNTFQVISDGLPEKGPGGIFLSDWLPAQQDYSEKIDSNCSSPLLKKNSVSEEEKEEENIVNKLQLSDTNPFSKVYCESNILKNSNDVINFIPPKKSASRRNKSAVRSNHMRVPSLSSEAFQEMVNKAPTHMRPPSFRNNNMSDNNNLNIIPSDTKENNVELINLSNKVINNTVNENINNAISFSTDIATEDNVNYCIYGENGPPSHGLGNLTKSIQKLCMTVDKKCSFSAKSSGAHSITDDNSNTYSNNKI